MSWVSAALIGVLAGLAVLHGYWGLGGRWPGRDDASLVGYVVGRTRGMRAPAPVTCFAVATALLLAAAMVGWHVRPHRAGLLALVMVVGFWAAALVFLLRGALGFIPALTRYAEGTPFHRLNRIAYSPLCLAIAAAFAAVW